MIYYNTFYTGRIIESWNSLTSYDRYTCDIVAELETEVQVTNKSVVQSLNTKKKACVLYCNIIRYDVNRFVRFVEI